VKYTLTGTGIGGGQDFPTGPNGTTETIGGLGTGSYTVTATGLNGHTIDNGQTTFQFSVITLTSPVCTVPTSITVDVASCTLEGANAGTEIEGVIHLPVDGNVTYQIDGATAAAGGPGYSEADGTHTVTATLTAANIASGITFLANPGVYTLSNNDTVATWSVTFTAGCLPTLPVWTDGASSTNAVCTAHGARGTISVVHNSSEIDPVTHTPEVSYTVENDATHRITNMGTSISTINVAPGHYTVTAAVAPGDGVVGDQLVFHLTVAVAAAVCGGGDTSLAFTGGTIAWAGFVLAGGMLFLGIAFLLIRRRGDRTAQ